MITAKKKAMHKHENRTYLKKQMHEAISYWQRNMGLMQMNNVMNLSYNVIDKQKQTYGEVE